MFHDQDTNVEQYGSGGRPSAPGNIFQPGGRELPEFDAANTDPDETQPKHLDDIWVRYGQACKAGELRVASRCLDNLKAAGTFDSTLDGSALREALQILDITAVPGTERTISQLFDLMTSCGLTKRFGTAASLGPVSRVTPDDLAKRTAIPASAFSPGRRANTVRNAAVVGGAWVLSRAGWLEPVAFVASAAFALWGLDSYVTGGVWAGRVTDLLLPGRKRRIADHEAGHLLVAYLLGKPIRGVLLDAGQARKAGLPGEAGTLFWDQQLEADLKNDRISPAAFS
eukprot:CAMPEP_0198219842 /NCGR_PEP_ID=MMETSP1445-20131203/76475_1 /TAXON_ID=36898 /ORGANISM="Pyramimonas sp., Strain CCMP2087" /LENGTH=283 /DNA_ID=CAMNT_0043897405 /DNA_START=268 /DNA_END=1114 /DNA_ORIENTATION=-